MLFRMLFLSTAIALTLGLPAAAGPLDWLDDATTIFDRINRQIDNADGLLNRLGYTADKIESLGKTLGIDLGNVDTSEAESSSDVAVAIYRDWSKTLSAEDAEIVQQFMLEYASGRSTSIEEMMSSSWYRELPATRQPRVIGLSGQFNEIVELVDDKNAFLAGVFL